MKKHLKGLVCTLIVLSIAMVSWKPAVAKKTFGHSKRHLAALEMLHQYVANVYEVAGLEGSGLSYDVFKKALTGFIDLKATNKLSQNSSILTVIDYTKSSREKRMWIIDIANKALLLQTWVAHGQGSGSDMANRFSNRTESHKSSVGFYLTNEIYYGKHGRSLKLDGLDAGFNSSARARDIVVHAADYVGQSAIDHLGHLGRSFGCPAVAPEVADEVINTIKDRTVIFINGNQANYHSKYLAEEVAASYISSTEDEEMGS